MRQSWINQPELSTTFWIRTIVWIALHIGRPIARILLYPISAYFVIFSGRARRASLDFLSRMQRKPATLRDTFRHFLVFGETILDRVFVFAGRDDIFTIREHSFEIVERYLQQGRGCLLVGAHVGSFEILRALARTHKALPIKAMTYGGNSTKINAILRHLNPKLFDDIVNMGTPASLLGMDEYIAQGGMVAMLGDRSLHGEKRVLCNFLGEQAWFPAAPPLLGSLFKAPVILFYCLRQGDARYDIHFELLGETLTLSRNNRSAEIQSWMQHYANRLEYYCRLAPYNWFNFYDFWDKTE